MCPVLETEDSCSRESTNGMGDATLTGYEVIRQHDAEDTMISNLQVKLIVNSPILSCYINKYLVLVVL